MKRFAAIFTLCALPTTAALAQSAITLGTAGSVVGSMGVNNATSGTITVAPPTGALGTPTLTWPTTTGTLALGGTGQINTTSPTITAANFNTECKIFTVNAASLDYALPSAATLQANGGCLFINNPSANTFTITPNAAHSDTLNGGSAGVAKTFQPQSMTLVTSDGSTADFAAVMVSGNLLSTANVWSAQQSNAVTTLSINATTHFTPNGASNNYKIALTSACNCTIDNPSATPVAGTSGIIEIDQYSGGAKQVAWGSQYYATGGSSGVQPNTVGSSINAVSYYVLDSTHILISLGADNATH